MSFVKNFALPVILCLFFSHFGYGQVAINELMASNSTTIADEDGDYEDWIEIYNYSDKLVDLSGYYLSDDYNDPYMWQFPAVTIGPGEYLLVWASGKDRTYRDFPLHTNFRVNLQGEEVFLTSPGGERVDEVAPTPVPTDRSYGRHPDGTGSWHYMQYPTPGNSNSIHLTGTELLLYYWFFDTDISNNTPLEDIEPFYSIIPGAIIEFISCIDGYPFFEGHENWRKASMERRNMPTPFNYRLEGNDYISYADTIMRGLQVRQPFVSNDKENMLILNMPATGFEDIVFRFAAMDEGAAEFIIVDYSTSEEESYTMTGLSNPVLTLNDEYRLLYELDFSDVPEVNNNPDFKIRLRFEGDDLEADNGDRVTFNNFSLDGKPIKSYYIHASANNNGMIDPAGFNRVYKNDNMIFNLFPNNNHVIDFLTVDGENVMNRVELDNNGNDTYELNNITDNHEIYASFQMDPEHVSRQDDQVLVYSNPSYKTIKIISTDIFNRIEIVNMAGEIVHSHNINSYEYTLDVSNIAAGVYLLLIHKEEGVISKKIQVI